MSADGSTSETVGIRVARVRKRRALTQQGLATRCAYARSHIAQVETGHKVATPAFVAAAAAALGVDPAELWGQPFHGDTARDDRVHALIADVRQILAYTDFPPDLDAPPRGLDRLAAELATMRRLLLRTRFTEVATRLPAVLHELTVHAYTMDDARVWALLNRAHALAVSLARRLGYNDLAYALVERAADSARRSQEPHLQLLVALPRALLLMNTSQSTPAVKLLTRAVEQVDVTRADAREVSGALNLRCAIVAARAGDTHLAWEHYGRAGDALKSAPPLDTHSLQFNAANVAVHGAAVAVELGDLEEAARRDATIGERTLTGLVPERRAHHQIDMSRVHDETGDYDRALARLLDAERIAPQMTRYHPVARAVTSHMAEVRREIPEPLRGLMSRLRIT